MPGVISQYHTDQVKRALLAPSSELKPAAPAETTQDNVIRHSRQGHRNTQFPRRHRATARHGRCDTCLSGTEHGVPYVLRVTILLYPI